MNTLTVSHSHAPLPSGVVRLREVSPANPFINTVAWRLLHFMLEQLKGATLVRCRSGPNGPPCASVSGSWDSSATSLALIRSVWMNGLLFNLDSFSSSRISLNWVASAEGTRSETDEEAIVKIKNEMHNCSFYIPTVSLCESDQFPVEVCSLEPDSYGCNHWL